MVLTIDTSGRVVFDAQIDVLADAKACTGCRVQHPHAQGAVGNLFQLARACSAAPQPCVTGAYQSCQSLRSFSARARTP